jgi:hypothetical protein
MKNKLKEGIDCSILAKSKLGDRHDKPIYEDMLWSGLSHT